MSIASNEMAAAQAQFEICLDASPVLQAMQTGIAELTRRMSSLELRMDRDERQSEIAIGRISALTGAVGGIDQRLIRVEERGVRLEEQLKAHTEQIQHNFDSLREHYDLRFDQVFGLLGQHEVGLIQNGQRLDRIEPRLDKVESRLDQMNKRFDQMDKRLDYMDQRFVRIEGKLDRFHWSVMAGLGVIVVQGVV